MDLNKLNTETRNQKSMNLDQMNTKEILELLNSEDSKIIPAIGEELDALNAVVEQTVKAISNGKRVLYFGAGTSGRLGVLDAVECPPTFGVDFNTFVGVIAGGEKAFVKAQEGAEDSKELAKQDVEEYKVEQGDVVIGIAASGRTPYVIGALEYAKEKGAVTVAIANNKNSEIGEVADYKVEVSPGPEVLTGSTRMKAGTTQKIILNMISTTTMIRTGKVYQNLMVDVQQTNKKLVRRATNIIIEATGVQESVAVEKLEQANGQVKTAIVSILADCSIEEAKQRLEKVNGFVREAIM